MVCAGVGLGLALGRRGTDTASLSAVGAAGAAGALRTLPTKSVSRDTECHLGMNKENKNAIRKIIIL